MVDSRPQTPIKLISTAPKCKEIKKSYRAASKVTKGTINNSIVNNNNNNKIRQNISIYHQLKSPLSPSKDGINESITGKSLSDNLDEGEEDIETTLNNLLACIDNNQTIEINHLKETLKKCLYTISHYKLQNQILKFNSFETMKRSEIESELMKKQIDQLVLKSPFIPSSERNNVLFQDESLDDIDSLHLIKHETQKKTRSKSKENQLKPNMRLVEKHTTNQKETGFNDHIKVFHLEKAKECW